MAAEATSDSNTSCTDKREPPKRSIECVAVANPRRVFTRLDLTRRETRVLSKLGCGVCEGGGGGGRRGVSCALEVN